LDHELKLKFIYGVPTRDHSWRRRGSSKESYG
jgi:hypothetical protein